MFLLKMVILNKKNYSHRTNNFRRKPQLNVASIMGMVPNGFAQNFTPGKENEIGWLKWADIPGISEENG